MRECSSHRFLAMAVDFRREPSRPKKLQPPERMQSAELEPASDGVARVRVYNTKGKPMMGYGDFKGLKKQCGSYVVDGRRLTSVA